MPPPPPRIVPRRDRHGRVYWYDPASGRRAAAPKAAARPLAYRVDARGRGYWTWLDSGKRAPAPLIAPRIDRAGRALDSTGRRIPKGAFALAPEPKRKPKPAPKSEPKRKPKPIRGPKAPPKRPPGRPPKPPPPPRKPPKPPTRRGHLKVSQVGPRAQIPGFERSPYLYLASPTSTRPTRLEEIFRRRLLGALQRSTRSAGEVGFRQYGIMFDVRGPLTPTELADIADRLHMERMQLVVRPVRSGHIELWLHQRPVTRRKPVVQQSSNVQVFQGMKRAEAAAGSIYDVLEELDLDFDWLTYFETDDPIYEG